MTHRRNHSLNPTELFRPFGPLFARRVSSRPVGFGLETISQRLFRPMKVRARSVSLLFVLPTVYLWADYEPSKIQLIGSSQDNRSIVFVKEDCNFGMAGFCSTSVLKFDRTSGSEELIGRFSGEEDPGHTIKAVAKAQEILREMGTILSTSSSSVHRVKSWSQEVLKQEHTSNNLFPVASVPRVYSMGDLELRVIHVSNKKRLGFELWLMDLPNKRRMLWKRFFSPENYVGRVYYYLLEDVFEIGGQPLAVVGMVHYQVEGDWGQSFILVPGVWDESGNDSRFNWLEWNGAPARGADPVLVERINRAQISIELSEGSNTAFRKAIDEKQWELFDFYEGWTPMLWAIQQSTAPIVAVQFLLERGYSLNELEVQSQNFPLMLAARKGDLDLFMFMIDQGARLEATINGRTAIDYFIPEVLPKAFARLKGRSTPIDIPTPHSWTVNSILVYGDTDTYKSLVAMGPSIDNLNDALRVAVINGYYERVKLLIDQGAHVNSRDPGNGETPLILAVSPKFKYDSYVESVKEDVRIKTIRVLMRAGANPWVRDAQGKTAFDHSQKQKRIYVTLALDTVRTHISYLLGSMFVVAFIIFFSIKKFRASRIRGTEGREKGEQGDAVNKTTNAQHGAPPDAGTSGQRR